MCVFMTLAPMHLEASCGFRCDDENGSAPWIGQCTPQQKSSFHEEKHVVICGLDGDFKRIKFGRLCDLIPLSDSIIKLHAKCNCGKDAIFSHRITNEVAQVVIGSSNYIPLCRTCYLNINNLSKTTCIGCNNVVLLNNTEPFVEDNVICNDCIDTNLDDEILYNCCNICDKYYFAADDTNDYEKHYDGDVCNSCLYKVITDTNNKSNITENENNEELIFT